MSENDCDLPNGLIFKNWVTDSVRYWAEDSKLDQGLDLGIMGSNWISMDSIGDGDVEQEVRRKGRLVAGHETYVEERGWEEKLEKWEMTSAKTLFVNFIRFILIV